MRKPGPGDLDTLDMRRRIGLEDLCEACRHVARRDARALRDLERDVRRPVAVLALLRRLEREATRRLVETSGRQGGAERGEELFADHKVVGAASRPVVAWYSSPFREPGVFTTLDWRDARWRAPSGAGRHPGRGRTSHGRAFGARDRAGGRN